MTDDVDCTQNEQTGLFQSDESTHMIDESIASALDVQHTNPTAIAHEAIPIDLDRVLIREQYPDTSSIVILTRTQIQALMKSLGMTYDSRQFRIATARNRVCKELGYVLEGNQRKHHKR